MKMTRLPRNVAVLAVPLILIAGIADFRGFEVGDLRTAGAVVLATVLITIAEHVVDRPLKKFLGSGTATIHYWAALSAVNASLSLLSLALAGIL
ncbi:MAG: hypothetical protein Q7S87_08950 [Agitococcus sp.]|nr:hypothetical protein [Agitococcus sp.]MDO9177028.1 hypothetical protein [Agitococcus sp.]